MSKPPPPGIYVPGVLFFTKNEEFDYPAIKTHILRLAEGGVTGFVVQGSNGEAMHLSQEERKQAIRFTRDTLDQNGFKHVVIIAGTGAQSTRETRKYCVDAKEAGAGYVLVLTPSTWALSRDSIIKFHREVADASPIPYLVYNFPTVTARLDLDSDIIGTLAKHPNIVGTKLSCGDIGKLHRLTSTLPKDQFAVIAGKSDVLLQGLLSGSAGVIGALVNIAPKAHVKLYDLWQKGDIKAAMELQALFARADWEGGRIGGIGGLKKLCQKYWGYGETYVRGPLEPAEDDKLQSIPHDSLVEVIKLEKSL